MRLCLLFFSFLTIVSADYLTEGFEFIDAEEIVRILNKVAGSGENRDGMLCSISFCHGQDRRGCSRQCAQSAHKFNSTIIEKHRHTLNQGEPDADVEGCVKECNIDCGKNDCAKECALWCSVHFEYENRKEYEAEFNELMRRWRSLHPE